MIAIFGLDLSFKSTGITYIELDNDLKGQRLVFGRVVYEDDLTSKRHIGINTIPYTMPHNITPSDLILNSKDENNYTQLKSTLRAMSCSGQINKFSWSCIPRDNKPDNIIVSIENYIMPSFGGPNSLPEVSGLITLQAFVRKFFIVTCQKFGIRLHMLTPTPTTVKKMFSGKGKADKFEMFDAFIKYWQGSKLLPTATKDDVIHLNDVIDSFAMASWGYKNVLNHKEELSNII